MDAKKLHHNIIERELAVLKQKYQLTLANAENEKTNNGNNKENVITNVTTGVNNQANVASKQKVQNRIEKKIERAMTPHPVGGVKRNIDDLIKGSAGKSKAVLDKFEKKMVNDAVRIRNQNQNQNRKDKSVGKASFGKFKGIQNARNESTDFLKGGVVDDITNILELDGLKKKVKY